MRRIPRGEGPEKICLALGLAETIGMRSRKLAGRAEARRSKQEERWADFAVRSSGRAMGFRGGAEHPSRMKRRMSGRQEDTRSVTCQHRG